MNPLVREKLYNAPALEPPTGVTPNFIDPSNIRKECLGVGITFFIISTLLVFARVYTKLRIVRKFVVEDYFVVLAWAVYAFGLHTLLFMFAQLPPGVHQWNLTLRESIYHTKLTWITAILYGVAALPLKISIVLQIIRIFVPNGIRNSVFWASHACIWINILYYVPTTFIEIFACSPRAKHWDPTITEGHCVDTLPMNGVTAGFNVLSDLLILMLPIKVIWSLSIPRNKKIGISTLFMVGIFATASAAVRLYYCVLLSRTQDANYLYEVMGLWCFIELGFGFFVSCVPNVPKLVTQFSGSRLFIAVKSSIISLLQFSKPGSTRNHPSSIKSESAESGSGQIYVTDTKLSALP